MLQVHRHGSTDAPILARPPPLETRAARPNDSRPPTTPTAAYRGLPCPVSVRSARSVRRRSSAMTRPLRLQIYAQRPPLREGTSSSAGAARGAAAPRPPDRARPPAHRVPEPVPQLHGDPLPGGASPTGVTEALVCSLERPEEAEDLTDAERAAIAFARPDGDEPPRDRRLDLRGLREHFNEPEIVELCFNVAPSSASAGWRAALHMVDDLPEGSGARATSGSRRGGEPEVVLVGGAQARR